MAQDEIEKTLQEAEETLKRIEAKTEKMRYDSQRDVLKHFDRIHDHLFLLNTVFITGYIALLQIGTHFSRFILILPFICLAILIYVEHYMKESARKYKDINNINFTIFFAECNRRDSRATIISFFAIILTSFELLYTIYICIFKLQPIWS